MNKTSPQVFVVMPVFNRLNFTKRCLQSIFNQNYKNYTVILINDGSTDGTGEFIKEKYPSVKVIAGDGTWWWTKSMYKGVKLALKLAKPRDYVLEMNNDLYFGPEYLNNLLTTAKKYPKSIIGSICVRAQKPTEVVEAGIRIDWLTGHVYGVAQTISQKLSYYKNMDVIKDLDALPGKGTLVPVAAFKKAGNFNYQKLPHYIADYEFALRAKRKGFKLLVAPEAIAKHYWEATGISSKSSNEVVSYKRAWNFLFARNSMSNIIDWMNFLYLACPKEHLSRNIYFSSLRLLKALFSIQPFYTLRPLLPFGAKIYHVSRLLLYRVYLYIIQFPEYHFKDLAK